MPAAISEIMRAKAAAAVASVRKKDSLLAGAVVAGSIVLGGIACQDTNGGGGGGEDGSGINPGDSLPLVDTSRVDSLPAVPPVDNTYPEYQQYVGDILLERWGRNEEGKNVALDTIGWAKVYTINGWGKASTDIVVELPNGTRVRSSMGKGEYISKTIPGYEGEVFGQVWRNEPLGKKPAGSEIESR
jgi:hypothetical protein